MGACAADSKKRKKNIIITVLLIKKKEIKKRFGLLGVCVSKDDRSVLQYRLLIVVIGSEKNGAC